MIKKCLEVISDSTTSKHHYRKHWVAKCLEVISDSTTSKQVNQSVDTQ